jgi:tetratricopeptide (TPR) repeat protein
LLEQTYLRLGRKDTLKRFYQQTLEKFPDDVLWHNRAGRFAITQGEFDEAEQLYSQAWQKSTKDDGKGDVASLDGYLRALLLGGRLDKVLEEGRKYVDSGFAPTAYLRMAEAKMKLGDKANAIQYCRKAVDKAGRREALVSNILRKMYSLLGAQEVLQFCKERLEANPDSFSANWTTFNLMRINGEYNKAIGYIDKCLQIMGPDNPRRVDYIMQKATILSLAYNRFADNDYLKKAIVEYESLLAEMPNNMGVLNNLAYMLAENDERLTKALEYAERALEKQPNNSGILDTYAYVLYKNGRFQKAAEYLQAALQQYESRRGGAPAEVYEHLGMIKEELGAGVEAIAAYKQALEIGGDKLSRTADERIKSAVDRLSRQ